MALTHFEYDLTIWMRFSVACMSFCCSCVTLLLIYAMKIRNGYFLLISSMTLCQILYDLNFFLGPLPSVQNCVVWHVLDYVGGLSFSLWSNILSFVVLYIVVKIQSLDIFANYWIFFLIAMGPSVLIGLMAIPNLEAPSDDDGLWVHWCVFDGSNFAYAVQGIYYWGRIATIVFNFAIFLYISFRVKLMMRSVKGDDRSMMVVTQNPIPQPGVSEMETSMGSGGRAASTTAISQSAAIVALVSRMKYYPLAQAIARSGSAWDQFDSYRYSCFASSLMSAICGPCSGILNFIIFLVMQPKAFQTLKSFFVAEEAREDGSFVSRSSSFAVSMGSLVPPPPLPSFSAQSSFPFGATSTTSTSVLSPGQLFSVYDYDEDTLDSVINEHSMSRSSTIVTRAATPSEL